MYIYTYMWICVYVRSFHLNEKIYTIYRKNIVILLNYEKGILQWHVF